MKKLDKRHLIIALVVNTLLIVGAVALSNSIGDVTDQSAAIEQSAAEKDRAFIENHQAEQRPEEVLSKIVNEWAAVTSGDHAVVVQNLNNEAVQVALNEGDSMILASTYKLFLSYAVLHQVERDRFTLEDIVPNTQLNIRECIQSLLAESSDSCAYDLGNMLGWQEIDAFLRNEGYLNTQLNNYDELGNVNRDKITTASDVAMLLKGIHKGTLLGQDYSRFMLALMQQNIHRDRIAAGVPDGTLIASKPGFIVEQGIENDAAIVYSPAGPYVLVVLSNGASVQSLADLSAEVYEYFND